MKRIVKTRNQTIFANETIMPEGYSGWRAQNIGTGDVEVDGFVLHPGDVLDYTSIDKDVVWDSPIVVVVKPYGALRVARLKYV